MIKSSSLHGTGQRSAAFTVSVLPLSLSSVILTLSCLGAVFVSRGHPWVSCILGATWASDLHEGAPAGASVLGPPGVQLGGVQLHVAEVGLPDPAGPFAAPPVRPIQVHLCKDAVVQGDVAPTAG